MSWYGGSGSEGSEGACGGKRSLRAASRWGSLCQVLQVAVEVKLRAKMGNGERIDEGEELRDFVGKRQLCWLEELRQRIGAKASD